MSVAAMSISARRVTSRWRWAPIVVAIVAIVMIASPVAAGVEFWTFTNIRNEPGAALQDADFSGHKVAVLWDEPGRHTFVRTSTSTGNTFASREELPGNTRQAELDVCGNDVYIAYARKYPLNLLIDLAAREMDTTGFAFSAISSEEARGRYPDVACAGGRLFVSWESKVGSEWRVYVDNALRSDLLVTALPLDLGPTDAYVRKPVLAGVNDRAYAAWTNTIDEGQIKFNRWSVGPGPGYAVTDLGDRRLAAHGQAPSIAAMGDKVVVAWHDCGDIKARVSNDRGASWGPVRTIFMGVCGSEFGGSINSVAIKGSRVIVSYELFAGDASEPRMISTRQDFSTFHDTLIWDPPTDSLLLGFVTTGGGLGPLAGAVDEGSRLRSIVEVPDEPCC